MHKKLTLWFYCYFNGNTVLRLGSKTLGIPIPYSRN